MSDEASAARRPLSGDAAFGLVIAAVAAIGLFWIVPMAVREAPGLNYAVLSPAFLPRILLAAILVLGLLATARALLGRRPAEPAEVLEDHSLVGLAKLAGCGLCAVGYYLLMPRIGALPTAMLASAALLVLGGVRHWVSYAILALALPVLVVLFFQEVAGVPLPRVWR